MMNCSGVEIKMLKNVKRLKMLASQLPAVEAHFNQASFARIASGLCACASELNRHLCCLFDI